MARLASSRRARTLNIILLGAIFIMGFAVITAVLRPGIFSSFGAETVKLGAILPLTGGAASLGKASLNGMKLAARGYNSTRGSSDPQVELVVEDDRAEPATSVSALQKLITANGIRLVLGPLTSGGTLAVAPIAERNRVIILSPGASAPAVTNAGDYVFRNELSEEFGAKAQATLGYTRLGYRTVALLYVNNDYGVGTAKVFREQFITLGGKIASEETFSPGATDFRTALQRIKTSNANAMFVVFQDTIVNIIKQHAELGLSASIYTTPVFEDPENLKVLGRLAEGIVYTYYGTFAANVETGISHEFSRTYRERFAEEPTYYAALGYDAARTMIHALRISEFKPEGVKANLYEIRDFPGVTGVMSFDHNGDVVKPVTLKTVRGGQFVPY